MGEEKTASAKKQEKRRKHILSSRKVFLGSDKPNEEFHVCSILNFQYLTVHTATATHDTNYIHLCARVTCASMWFTR